MDKIKRNSMLRACVAMLMVFVLVTGVSNVALAKSSVDRQCTLKNPVKLADYGDIVINGEKDYSFVLPCDRVIICELEIKNTSDSYKYVRFDTDNSKMDTSSYLKEHLRSVTVHPQPNWIEMQPKEKVLMQVSIDAGDFEALKDQSGISLTQTIDLTIKDVDSEGHEQGDGIKQSFKLKCSVSTYSKQTVTSGKKCTVTLCGYLKDSSGKPIQNANVQVSSGWAYFNSVMTNAKGYYSVNVMSYYNDYLESYAEYGLTTRADGYRNKTVVVIPKKGTVQTDFVLTKDPGTIDYTQTKVINTKIQPYDLDASKNGSIIATVPFHTQLDASKTDGKRKLTVTNKTGKKLFTKDLPSETPYVDVSEDGKYVVATAEFGGTGEWNAVIFNKKGKEVYRTPRDLPRTNPYTGKEDGTIGNDAIYCARLTSDNKILACGSTIGELWIIDWQKDEVLWHTDIAGQLRTIDFSSDGKKVFVTGGGGYAYCFDLKTGKQLWKTFIQAWATESTVTGKYFIATVKSEGYTLLVLNAKTGKKLWDYPTTCRGTYVSVSPDGKKLFWDTDNGGEYSPLNAAIFDLKTGKVLTAFTVLNKYEGMVGKWSADGKQICIKSGKGFGIYNTSTGETLYEKQVVDGSGDALAFSLYASDDLKYIVAGFNKDKSFRFWGQLYYFKRK